MDKLMNYAMQQMSHPTGHPTQAQHMHGTYAGQQAPYGAPYGQQPSAYAPYGAQAPYGQDMHTGAGGMGYHTAPAGYPTNLGTAPQAYPQSQYPQQQPSYQQGQNHHYGQPQQYQSHGGQQVVVVSPRFCLPQRTVLVMQEQFGMYRSDDFSITDTTGRPFFRLAAAVFSIGGRRQLLDANNMPLLHMEKKMLSLRGRWFISRADTGARVAEVKPALTSLTPSVTVYLNDGDREPDFVIKGDFRGKRFSISQRIPGRGEVQIAAVERESRFSNSTAFMMSVMTDAQKYFLTIEPGVDAAFVTALATLCDEIFNDKEGA